MREKNYDVLAISESWLNSTTTNAEVEIAGYKITKLDRTKKIGGGQWRIQGGWIGWISTPPPIFQ